MSLEPPQEHKRRSGPAGDRQVVHRSAGGYDDLPHGLDAPPQAIWSKHPAAPVPESVLARTDLIVANRHEYAAIPALDAARLVAVTHGAAGAELRQGGVRIGYAKAPEVVAIDGTGAGDSFVAALVVGLLEKREPQDALRRACIAGALAASRAGAQPSLPTRAELDRLSDRMAADPADPLATDMTLEPT